MPVAHFLRAFALGFGAISALNCSVNPYDQYGAHGLPPLTLTARGEKSLGVSQASPATDGLVIGSSRVLLLSPAQLEAETGVGFYNAGVYYGRTEDFLALPRRFETTHARASRVLVIGLDIDAFADQIGPDPELIRTAALQREIPECITLNDRLQPTRELLPWHQTTGALKLLYAAVLLSIAWVAPNAWRFDFRGGSLSGVAAALVFVVCVLRCDSASSFLYFRF